MNALRNSPTTVELSLSQDETARLLAFLEDLTAQLREEADIDGLRDAYDKLQEADAVAVWLGEDVHADLTPAEGSELVEAIAVRLEEDELLAEVSETLAHVRQQLDACLREGSSRRV